MKVFDVTIKKFIGITVRAETEEEAKEKAEKQLKPDETVGLIEDLGEENDDMNIDIK